MTAKRFDELPEDVLFQVNQICNRYETACQASPGQTPYLEDFLDALPAEYRGALINELLPIEVAYRRRGGETCAVVDYIKRFPELDVSRLEVQFEAPTRIDGSLDETPATRPDRPAIAVGSESIPKRIGDYEIIDTLGRGGMGAVFRAVHMRMDRTVALKVLRPEIRRDPLLIQRFEREVKAAARLSHRNIVAALDAREEDGLFCLITEFIDGADLATVVQRQGPLAPADAIDAVLQAARGLEFAHAQKIIHRDIKPANLLRDAEGTVKVLDMGLARMEQNAAGDDVTELTETGMVMGTAAYISPEQARNTRNADERSDIYSLGCTLFFLMTGRPAYDGETVMDTLLAHASAPVPSLSESLQGEVPRELESVFQRMVAKDPADRFQSMTEAAEALQGLTDHRGLRGLRAVEPPGRVRAPDPVAATVPDRARTPRRQTRPPSKPLADRRILATVAVLAVVAVAAAIIVPLLGPDDAPDYSLQFNGRDSWLVAPTLVPDPSDSVTLEAVCLIEQTRVSNVISWLGPDWMAVFLNNDGRWGVARRVGGESRLIVSRESVRTGQWYHVAGTWDGQQLRLFLNGEPVATVPMDFRLSETSGGLHIGGVPPRLLPDGQNDRFFAGRIRGVRISRGVRYQEKFEPPNGLKTDRSTLAVYSMEEGRGTTAADGSGNGHDAVINNASWLRE